MMTLNKAKGLATASLASLLGRPPEDLLVLDELTQCRRVGWIFFYEARTYLENGNLAQGLYRSGPVVVTHAGEVHHLGRDRAVDDALRDFEAAHRRLAALR